MNEEPTFSLEELGEIKTVKVYNQAYVDKQQKRIETLERENAELKEQNRKLLESCEGATMMYEDLCKAKEIIKKFSEFVNNEVEYDSEHPQEHTDLWNELCERVEQFLNGEVEE